MTPDQAGKDAMIRQGYVPATCTLPVELAGPLIYAEICRGKSPCWGCQADRTVCRGQAYRMSAAEEQLTPEYRRRQTLARLEARANYDLTQPGMPGPALDSGNSLDRELGYVADG